MSIKKYVSLFLVVVIVAFSIFIFSPQVSSLDGMYLFINNRMLEISEYEPIKTYEDKNYVLIDIFSEFPYLNVKISAENGGSFIIANNITGSYISAICKLNVILVNDSKNVVVVDIKIETINGNTYYYVPIDQVCEILNLNFETATFENGISAIRIYDNSNLISFNTLLSLFLPEAFQSFLPENYLDKKVFIVFYDVNEYTLDLCEFSKILGIPINYLISENDLNNYNDILLDMLSYSPEFGILFETPNNIISPISLTNNMLSEYFNQNAHFIYSSKFKDSFNTGIYFNNYYFVDSILVDSDEISDEIKDLFEDDEDVIIAIQCNQYAATYLSRLYSYIVSNYEDEYDFSYIKFNSEVDYEQ